jgi:hypothetical protein
MIIHYQPLSTIINQPLLTSTNPHKGNVLFPSHGPERSSRSHYCHPRHCSQSAPRAMLMATLNGVIKRSNEKSPPSKWKNSFRSIWRFCFFPLFGFYNFRLINFAVSMVLRYLGSSKFMGRIGPSNLLGDPLKGHWPCPCPPQCEDIPSFHIFPSPIFKWCYVKKMEYPQIHENPRNKWYISYHIIPSYRHTVIPSYRHTVIPSYHHTIIPSYHHTIIPSYIIHHTSYIIHHTSASASSSSSCFPWFSHNLAYPQQISWWNQATETLPRRSGANLKNHWCAQWPNISTWCEDMRIPISSNEHSHHNVILQSTYVFFIFVWNGNFKTFMNLSHL